MFVKMNLIKSDDNLSGEGGILIHGRAILRDFDRGDLFSQELDRKLTSIVCNVCMTPSRDLESWRTHCVTKHATLPGYKPTLLSTGVSPTPQMFLASAGKYPCPLCKRRFPNLDSMVDHRHSQMRCVRLVCGQCQGLWADLETHVRTEHGQEDTCNTCGLVGVEDILEHYHTHHDGFAGVIAETEIKCAGDGVTVEWFETVLATKARFLASEVKPEKESNDSYVDIIDTSILYKNTNSNNVPKITSVGSKTNRNVARSSPNQERNKKQGMITSETERHQYNIECYEKLRNKDEGGVLTGFARSNHCDICGFEPYTKNKYREKQDHLAKNHFKERIEALLPLTSPYTCPNESCEYLGKDKQDIQRHYTGKHNILKMWVDAFLREMSERPIGGVGDSDPLKIDLSPNKNGRNQQPELTFQQMEMIAIKQQKSKDVIIEDNDDDDIEGPEESRVALTLEALNSNIDLSNSCLTISKISKVTKSQERQVETPPSISLIRISKNPSSPSKDSMTTTTAAASSLLLSVAARAATSPVKPTLSFKHPCNCGMSFPTQSAKKLHLEVCQFPTKLLSPPSPIHDEFPPKKKKRPPPPLIPL